MKSTTCRRAAFRPGRGIAAVVIVGLCAATLARAQEAGGLNAVVDLSFGGRLRDTSPGKSDNALTSTLGLRLSSATRSQALDFGLRGNLSYAQKDGILVRPQANLGYRISNRSSELDLSASYRQEKVDGAVLIEDFTGAELLADSGVRRSSSVSLHAVTGKDAPFGTDTKLDYNQRRYTDTADPNLADQDRWSASTTLRFEVTPTLTLRTTGSYSERHIKDEFDNIERKQRISLGADMQLDPAWTLSADIGLADIETRLNDGAGGRRTSTEKGDEFSLSGVRSLHNGTFSLSASRSVTAGGGETSVRAGRAFTLKNSTVDASIGLVRFDSSGSYGVLALLAYDHTLANNADISVSLRQEADTNSDDQNILRSQFSASFNHPLTARSRWSIDTSFAHIQVVDANSDQSRAQIGLGYSHDLTRDWALNLGVQHRRSYSGGTEVKHTNSLTASIGRSFSFRP